MTIVRPEEERIEQIAKDLAPDVVRIRFNIGQDWSDHPAVYFRITLSDTASRPERLADVTRAIRTRLFDELGLSDSDLLPYFRFRSESEQQTLKDGAWD